MDELTQKIANYLTSQFIGGKDALDLPDDECVSEAEHIMEMVKEAGYVKLAENQEPPRNPHPLHNGSSVREGSVIRIIDTRNPDNTIYKQAQDDMLKDGFVRGEREGK